MAKDNISIRLQGHEKFALRDGWLNKGLNQIEDNPHVFQGKEGPDILGIGNNMVKSLRYWLNAFELIEEKPGKGASLSSFGQIIKQYDPDFEDIFTIWLLHSKIANNSSQATTWYLFFNKCDIEEFDKEELIKILTRELKKYAVGKSFSEQSLANDVDVLLNMYGKDKKIEDPEDKNVSPLAQLGLIGKNDGKYVKKRADRRKFGEWILLYELAGIFEKEKSISIDAIAGTMDCIASVYNLSRILINELLDIISSMGYIYVNRTAGLDVIYKNDEKTMCQLEIIKEYYEKHIREIL